MVNQLQTEGVQISLIDKIIKFVHKFFWVFFSIFVLIFVFLCFYNLANSPIQDWDEARHGVNAYEMLKNKQLFANYYEGELDYWNYKPPISYWTIMIGFKIFGYNTLGLRFFSALSMVIAVVLIALFLKQKSGPIASIVSLVLFISCGKMLWAHCTRTADPDAVFFLFYTIAILSLLKIKDGTKYLYICGISFSLAFLTKSWHAMTLVPTVFFYLLFTKSFKNIKWRELILFFIFSIFLIFVWAIIRFTVDGVTFFKGMLEVDLLKRSQGEIEGNVQPPLYYFTHYLLSINTFSICFYLNIATIIYCMVRRSKLSDFAKIFLISFISVFTIYSISKVKLYWYIYPVIISFVLFSSEIFEKFLFLKHSIKWKNVVKTIGFMGVILLTAYSSLFSFNYVLRNVPRQKQQPAIITEYREIIEKGSVIYYQDKDTANISQSMLLYLELNFDAKAYSGGLNRFLLEKEGYIILDKTVYEENKDLLNMLHQTSNNYYLCTLKK